MSLRALIPLSDSAVWRFPERPEWGWYAEYWDLIEPLDYPFFKGDALTDPGPEGAARMALRFLTSTPGVHSAIVGTTSFRQAGIQWQTYDR